MKTKLVYEGGEIITETGSVKARVTIKKTTNLLESQKNFKKKN